MAKIQSFLTNYIDNAHIVLSVDPPNKYSQKLSQAIFSL